MQVGTRGHFAVHETQGCLVVTLPIDMDTEVAGELYTRLIYDISRDRPLGLVVDLSMVTIMPSDVTKVLVRLARTATLLDSPTVICDIPASLASALAMLDIGFEEVPKARDIDHAIALLTADRSMNKTGRQHVRASKENRASHP
ncbi:STAS domain-containing protein [Halomonas aquatica]|uniref:STAS domain-containing protein n=1 Tax=Halomonas aquatica TaxID=3151123 RepID=A0ABV1NBE7_9GAMM